MTSRPGSRKERRVTVMRVRGRAMVTGTGPYFLADFLVTAVRFFWAAGAGSAIVVNAIAAAENAASQNRICMVSLSLFASRSTCFGFGRHRSGNENRLGFVPSPLSGYGLRSYPEHLEEIHYEGCKI